MPYKKPYRRRYRRKKPNTAYNMAKKALKKVNEVKKGIEIKHYDLDLNGPVFLDNLSTVISLNVGIPQGLTDTERIGDSIYMKGVRLKWTLDLGADLDRVLYRFILMYDKEDTISTASQFLESVNNSNVINSPYDVDQRHKYIILHDKVYHQSQGYKRIQQITFSKKLNKHTQYFAGTTDVSKGRLKLWLFSDNSDGVTNRPFIDGWSRVWYQDS